MLDATKSVLRSKAKALAGRLAEVVDGIADTARQAIGIGAGPSPRLVPVRVRGRHLYGSR